MNPQAVLDQIAFVAGGAATTVAGVYNGAGKITSSDGKTVTVAYSSLRGISEMQVSGFVFVCVIDETSRSRGSPFTAYTHRIRAQLMVDAADSDMRTATRLLQAFVPAFYTAFSQKVKLNGTASNAEILSNRGPYGVEPLYPGRHAIEFIFEATEKEGVAYAA